MNALTKALALPLFTAVLSAGAFAGAANAEDATKADPMMADCMKKADMETDAMKKKDMAAECSKGAMKADPMKPADPMAPAADPMKPADPMAPAAPKK